MVLSKPEMEKKQFRRDGGYRKAWYSNMTTSKSLFSEPMVGLEDAVFTFGRPHDAANFQLVKLRVTRFVLTQSW